jgi:hypothetical protein
MAKEPCLRPKGFNPAAIPGLRVFKRRSQLSILLCRKRNYNLSLKQFG